MKKLLIIVWMLALTVSSAYAGGSGLDAPHNETNTIGCLDCHGTPITLPTDDSICLQCHVNASGGGYSKNSAPKVATHSSDTTSTKYGTWAASCRDCHRVHTQTQRASYGSATYLGTGTVTSVINNVNGTATFSYSGFTELRPGWSDFSKWGTKTSKDRGLIMYPNPADVSISFEILSATADTITTKGVTTAYPAGSIPLPNTFALTYGENVRASLIYPTTINQSPYNLNVKFFDKSGANSFAFDESGTHTDPTPDGVCQVCHDKTSHWKRDGSLAAIGVHAGQNGTNCTVCHKHTDGFSAAGACNACHGFPPIVNSLGGPNGLVNTPAATGAKTPGAHATHATTSAGGYGFACEKCHSGGMPESPIPDMKIQIGFNISAAYPGGTYDGRTLTNGQLPNGYSYMAGNAATVITNNGEQSCTNIYCHSNAKIGTSVQSYSKVTWADGPLTCVACHQYPPAYANGGAGTATANSHTVHVINNGFGCQLCHSKTVSSNGSSLDVKWHANTNIDVYFDSTNPNGSYASATKTCSTTNCHGDGTPQWGGSANCQDCHFGSADVDDYVYGNGKIAKIKNAGEWDTTGHGKASGTYASGNPAAGFTSAGACLNCHDDTVAHNASGNYFRLKNISDATWGKNGTCQACHAPGSAGTARKVGSTHYGTKHSAANSGGQFCWDCHDPHGDANVFMVHAAVAKTSDAATGVPITTAAASFTAFSTGTDYAGGSNSTRICNTCHTNTNHYTSTTSDTHNASIRCTNCHKHTGETKTDAFKPSGENCYDCHSSAGGPTPGTTSDAYHARHIKTAYVGKVSLGDYGNYMTNQWYRYANIGGTPDMGCGYCHPQSSATHMNGVVNLNFDPADAGAPGTLKGKNHTTQSYNQDSRVSVTCSSVYCHSNGYNPGTGYGYQTSDNWYTSTISGDVCAKCHGNSPNSSRPGSPAHGKHVVGIHYKSIFTGTSGLATTGTTETSSHGNASTSTTINCNICHSATVSSSGNDRNSVCATCHTGSARIMTIAAGSTSHVNGTVDVVFAGTTFRSKAQLRDNITNVPELDSNWTRVNGYKEAGSNDLTVSALNSSSYSGGNCTVACHNGNTVRWNSTVTCNSCHTDLP